MSSVTSPGPRSGVGQLLLFPAAPRPGRRAPSRGRPPVTPGRNARMAARLDGLARGADGDARACARAGDVVGEREARDRAADSRRAAALLRAGPAGVGRLLAS